MKFQETKNIKTFYKPNILNINELKIRKNQSSVIAKEAKIDEENINL